MLKRIFAFILVLILGVSSTLPVSAAEVNEEIQHVVYPYESRLPYNGTDHFYFEYKDTNENARVTYYTVYGFEYTKGAKKYGSWREGASGGSNVSEMTLTFDKSNDVSFNISFTASVTGEYTKKNKGTIGGELGVTLGAAASYSLGSGTSVQVPKGKHYTIKYRPVYYTYQVVETEYMEAYVPGYGWHKPVVGTKTCYVDVFSHWDYTVVES